MRPPRPATDHSATVLAREDWQRLQRNHQERAKALTSAHLERRARAQKHPIWDFLFTYYSHTPAQLARWYPGIGVVLRDAGEFSAVRYYAVAADGSAARAYPKPLLYARLLAERQSDRLCAVLSVDAL